MTTRQKRAARELVDKLERLAAEAQARLEDIVVHHHASNYPDETKRLEERATNYRHAATLARNLLGVDP